MQRERKEEFIPEGTKTLRKHKGRIRCHLYASFVPWCLCGKKNISGHGVPCPYAYEGMVSFMPFMQFLV
jgi:hypothetical protein